MGMLGFSGYKSSPGVHEPPPSKGWPRYKFIVQNHFFRLIKLNLLFIVFCIPVFTIPAAIAGMSAVLMSLVREGNTFMWNDFWSEFKTDFPQRMLIWFLLMLVPNLIGYIPILMGYENAASFISVAISSLLFVVTCYWFPMIVKLDLSVWQALKNAVLLVPLEWKRSCIMLVMGAVFSFLAVYLYPYSLILLLLGAFSYMYLAICVMGNDTINERILKSTGTEDEDDEDEADGKDEDGFDNASCADDDLPET